MTFLLKNIFLLTNVSMVLCQSNFEVKTLSGTLRGHVARSFNGKQYFAFEGIPYAQPPIGDNRFEEPKPIEPWGGIWQANTLHKCLQYNHYTEPGEDFVIGQEDCLYLNIYTPALNNSDTVYDVIIFIHGGAFMFNSAGSYGPKYILDMDIVYVTLNYRLGPLGFLSTEDSVVPGNNGLKDQLLALKWIKRNIIKFNGNPDSITLTGMSAGGASVHIHFLSTLSKGLFHRGIAQSGTALNPWVLAENSHEKFLKLATILGCDHGDTKRMIKCLKNRSGYQVVNAVQHFLPWLYNPFSPFGVVIDKWSEKPILSEHPYLLLKKKQVQDLPLIFSNVESEGLYPAADFLREARYLEEINNKWNDLVPFVLDYNNTVLAKNRNGVSEKIKTFYMGNDRLNDKTFAKFIKLVSDRLFIADIEKAAKLHAAATTSPVYYYYFSYRGAHSKSETRSRVNTNFGASHGDDSVYVLSSNINTKTTKTDQKMSDLLLHMWTSYAKNGCPKLGDITWTPVSNNILSDLTYAHIESPELVKIKQAEELGNGNFWNSLPILENDKLFGVKDEL